MTKRVSNCVGCGIPGCRNCVADITFCDECGEENAEYVLDGDDFCETCLVDKLKEEWNNLSCKDKKITINEHFSILEDEEDFLNDIFEELLYSEQAMVLNHYLKIY